MYFIHPVPERTLPMEWKLPNKLKIILSLASSGGKERKTYTHTVYSLKSAGALHCLHWAAGDIQEWRAYLQAPVRHLRAPTFRIPQPSKQDQSITTTLRKDCVFTTQTPVHWCKFYLCKHLSGDCEYLNENASPIVASELLENLGPWN